MSAGGENSLRARLARLPLLGNLGWPIALKEIRAWVRRDRYFWSQFLYLSCLGLGVILIIAMSRGDEAATREGIGGSVFWGFFSLQIVLLSIIFPAFAATSFSGERTERSFDLLITSDLTPAELVWGKFIGTFGNATYLLLVTLPVLSVCILFGGVSLSGVLENYFVLLLGSALLTMYGIWVSSGTSSNVKSVILTYAPVLLLGSQFTVLLMEIRDSLGGRAIGLISFVREAAGWGGDPVAAAIVVTGIGLFGFFFLGAVVRLSSLESSATALLRVFAFALAIVGSIACLFLSPPLDVVERVTTFHLIAAFGVVLILGSALGFVATDLRAPRRIVRALGRHPIAGRVGWLFCPGGIRSLLFVLVLMGVVAGGLTLSALFVFDLQELRGASVTGGARNGWVAVRTIYTLVFAAIFAYCGIGMLLSSLGVNGALNRAIVIAVAVLATLLGLIWTVQSHVGALAPSPVLGVSVLVTLMKYREAADSHIDLVRFSTALHLVLGASSSLASIFVMKSRGFSAFRLRRPVRARVSS